MIDPRTIPSPASLLRKHGLEPRKAWGQNFLHAVEIHHRIVAAAELGAGSRVVEIGAGLGTLTEHLLATGAEVWAIERDRDLCRVLRSELGHETLLVLIEADAVRYDYSAAARGISGRPVIVGNLPYQLTGPLLFQLLDHDQSTGKWIVMVQREVADRLCAEPGTRDYGGVTATLSRVRAIRRVCAVSRGCFLPAPRVDSAVVELCPRPEPKGDVRDPTGYRALVRAVFQRRRKILLNGLTPLADRARALAWCERAGIDPGTRPEKLGPEQFAALQRAREQECDA